MPHKIERLTLKGFRGASIPVLIDFDPHTNITLIFGENGTGKSTLCDAIDFVCNGKFGSLGDKSSSERKSDAVVAIDSLPHDLEVHLNYNGQTFDAKLKGTKADLRGNGNRPLAHVLRRADITRVVEAAPSEKYEALRLFITAPGIEKSEKTLRDALRKTKAAREEIARDKRFADEALESLWKSSGSSEPDAVTWAAKVVSVDTSRLKHHIDEMQTALSAMDRAESANKQVTSARANVIELETHLSEIESKISATNFDQADAALITLLKDTQTFLASNHTQIEACPVCGVPNSQNLLYERVSRQLDAMSSLVELQDQREALSMQLKSAHAVLKNAEQTMNDATRDIDLANPNDRAVIEATLNAHRNDLAQFDSIRLHQSTIENKTQLLIDVFQREQRLEQMLEIVETRRKEHVENVLKRIAATVDEMYSRIHPDEPLGAFQFYLKPNVSGSVEFDARFLNKQVSPASYYSEAHLDTLGLCVFLALAKHNHNENTLIVLDDVLTSVDDAHLERIIQLVHDEAPNFCHVIITTHFRPWRERYRFQQAASERVQLIELMRWSPVRGIRHTKTQLAVEELRDALNVEPINRRDVANQAGLLLESFLDFLTLRYQCRLPRKDSFSLVELARGLDGKLKKALRIERHGENVLLESLLNQIDGLAYIRNQVGAHYNERGMNIPDSDVIQLGEVTLKLADTMVCPSCGQLPNRTKSGSWHECQCGMTKLHPLIAPN
jgi:energy-coupling factor transporter ATP-binding protein EcfA2